jgi:cystathionine beta-lyase/cystathionine gamma-synthase
MTDIPLGTTRPLVPPLYQAAVYVVPDLDALERLSTGQEAGFIYARDSHPNAVALETQLAMLEGATWSLVFSSGMASLSALLFALTQQGDRVLASRQLYGRTLQLLGTEAPRFGVTTTFVDIYDLATVEAAFQVGPVPRFLLVETISNPLLRVANLPALAKLCERFGSLLIVDNTFATPVLCRPLEQGAAIVMESLTKMISGHSDVTLGMLAGNVPLEKRFREVRTIWGLSANPFDCWLTLRSLPTLELRQRAACANADALAAWLPSQPGVRRVHYPRLAEHPDRLLSQILLPQGAGSMLSVELAEGRVGVNRFMQRAKHIPFSPSLGDTFTTCSYPAGTSHRYMQPQERERQGITEGLLRLSIGTEPLAQLQQHLRQGLPDA